MTAIDPNGGRREERCWTLETPHDFQMQVADPGERKDVSMCEDAQRAIDVLFGWFLSLCCLSLKSTPCLPRQTSVGYRVITHHR